MVQCCYGYCLRGSIDCSRKYKKGQSYEESMGILTRFSLAVVILMTFVTGCDRPVGFYEEEEFFSEIQRADILYEPHLIRPKNGGIVRNSTSVILRWSWIPSATSYSVQVAEDTLFRDPVFSAEADTTFIQTGPLLGSRYYWRVRSNKAQFESRWSDFNMFMILAG